MKLARSTSALAIGRVLLAMIACAACSTLLFAARQTSASGGGDLALRIARLGALEGARVEPELQSLAAAGAPAAASALAGFGEADPLARRRRAWLVRVAGGAAEVAPALAALADPDPAVRTELALFLARADLGAQALELRIEALARLALEDPVATLRRVSLAALADLDEPRAFAALDQALDRSDAPERELAARLLAQRVRAREVLAARVERAFATAGDQEGERGALGPEVQGILLAGYGRALAEREPEKVGARERAPLLVAARSADPRLRRAFVLGFDALVRRLLQQGDAARADRVLAGFAEQGLDARFVLHERARLALALGSDPARALALARELGSFDRDASSREARSSRARALALAAIATLAAGDARGAEVLEAEQAALVDGLLAERVDLEHESLRSQQVDWLHLRAGGELLGAVCALATATEAELADPSSAPVRAAIARARTLHRFELEAQLCAWRGDADAQNGLDALLDSELGPFTLLFENPRFQAWPAARSLAMRAAIGRVLASVAPEELLGFEPYEIADPSVRDPHADPERLAILQRTQLARIDLLRKQRDELVRKVLPEAAGNPAGIDPSEERELQMLELEMEDALDANRAGRDKEDWSALRELRVPSTSALWLARELRNEGRAEESRKVATSLREALAGSAAAQKYIWSLELEAEIELAIGSSYSDEDQPQKAEVELLRAVERLEAIEKLILDRGFGGAATLRVRALRCGALVSLAVNANVKQRETAKAIAYFERAFELRQDDFMRVLLACYRARAGRAEEARALLRSVVPVPGTHYNMACTWALLGERELALEFLKRDFEENQLSGGALVKQKQWAKRDPDLESVRGDEGFRALVGE